VHKTYDPKIPALLEPSADKEPRMLPGESEIDYQNLFVPCSTTSSPATTSSGWPRSRLPA
jgi:hypothetical protein